MRAIKFIITSFFLISSFWIAYLIFSRNFAISEISLAAEDWNENTFMILLTSTGLSAIGVLCMGILSMFVHFVFIKLIYADEVKQAAFFYVKNRKYDTTALKEYKNSIDTMEWSKMTTKQKFFSIFKKIKLN